MRSFVLLFLVWLAILPARAEQIEVQIIRASLALKTTDEDLKPLHPSLKKLFGYDHYTRLGQAHREKLPLGERKFFNLGEGFSLFITMTETNALGAQVEFDWYSGKAAIVKSSVRLAPNSPLLVRGPEVGQDWIILALILHR